MLPTHRALRPPTTPTPQNLGIFAQRRRDWRDATSHRRPHRRIPRREVHQDVAQVRRRHQPGHGRRKDPASHLGRERHHRGPPAAPLKRG